MDYLMFIDQIARRNRTASRIQYLVSGSDAAVRRTVLEAVVRKCRDASKPLIVISDSGITETEDLQIIHDCGYRIENGLSGDYFLFNPFRNIHRVDGLSQIRQLLDILDYDEKQKGKLTSYLSFLRHLELLETGRPQFDLTLEKIGEYCSSMAVETKLQQLVDAGKISEIQRLMYLQKYAECSSAGADFEDMMFLLMPFTRESGKKPGADSAEALLLPTGELGEDDRMRDLILKLLQFGLKECPDSNIAVLVLDRGYGSRAGIANLLLTLPPRIDAHIFSGDIFTLCAPDMLTMVLNRFPARVYSRHSSMSSAQAIERACGEVEVIKHTYTVAYDRRWTANKPWDMLLGNNKTETYGQQPPVREPRYHKEMILQLGAGVGIVEYLGSSSVFSI